jgi:lysophospholipase L1-like esterase
MRRPGSIFFYALTVQSHLARGQFWNIFKNKRREMASLSNPPSSSSSTTYRVECFGDSLTDGWMPTTHGVEHFPYADTLRKTLRERGDSVAIGHKGFPGATAEELLSMPSMKPFLPAVAGVDLAVLLAGTNDLAMRSHQADKANAIFQDVWKMHLSCHAAGVKTVAVAIPKSHYQTTSSSAGQTAAEINELLRAVCSEHEDVCRFFAWPESLDYQKNSPFWNRDGLHMTERGYAALGEALAEPVAAALGLASGASSSSSSSSSSSEDAAAPSSPEDGATAASSSSSSSSSSLSAAAPPAAAAASAAEDKPAAGAADTAPKKKKKNLFPGAKKPFPEHWGPPPRMQTRDFRPWPEGYGAGSGTVAKWINEKLAEDRAAGL